MRKTICGLLALTVVVCLLAVTAFAGSANASLEGVTEVLPGSEFTVDFCLAGTDLYAVSGVLEYDTSLLELVSVEQVVSEPWIMDINGNYFLAYDDGMSHPISEKTPIYTATFRLRTAAEAGTELRISCKEITASDRRNDANVGSVHCTVSVVSFFPGDANGNGTVEAQDLALLREYLAGRNIFTGVSAVTVAEGADVNGDGHINAIDLAMLRSKLQ